MDTKGVFKKAVNLVTLSSFLLWNLAAATPEGGQVVAGSAQISQSQNQTVINQSSQSTVINWNGFNTAANESVKFNQPNSSAIALNKINSGLPTNFNGSLSANGQVWIVNPAGVLFGSTANINVAGLLATTHNINNNDFMNGHYNFDAPSNLMASIINNGNITVADSGIVTLVAPYVVNNGIIQANLGKVALSTGGAFVLDLYGDSLINFGSNAPLSNGAVSNAGQIIANGGKVYMTANYASGVLDNMISMSGTIEAKSLGTNNKGQIVLYGGDYQSKKLSGVTKVTGKLDASDGGFIETSGAYLDIRSSAVINSGVGGTWLLDPYNITVVAGAGLTNNSGAPNFTPSGTSTIGADLINTQLNGLGNVTLDTGAAGGDVGDININAPLTWTSFGTGLTLNAAHDITIAAAITWNSGGSLSLTAGNNIMINGPLTYTNNNLNTGNILMTAGGDIFLNSPISFINVPPHSFDLNLNAGGDIIMNSTVTNNVPSGSSVPFPFVHYTATGDILINSQFLITNLDQSLVINLNAGNEVHINANQSLPGNGGSGGSLNVTATNGIFINTPSLLMGFGAGFPSYEFFSPVHLLSDTQIDGQVMQVDSTIDGAFNLTLNSLVYEFRDNIGSITPLASLTVSGSPFYATGSIASISTTGEQTYNDNFFFFLINGMTFNASKVILNNGLNNNNATGAITFNSDLELTGQFGQVALGLPGATTITGSTILHNATMYVGGQAFSGIPAPLTFMGPVTVLGNASLNVRNHEGSLEFMSTVDGTGSLNINNLSVPAGGNGFVIVDDVLDASSMSSFSIPGGALVLNGGTIIRDTQSYNIGVLVTALGGTIDANTLVTFNSIVIGPAIGNPGALTINGNAEFNFDVGGSFPLASLYVSGTTTGATVTTVGDQNYIGPYNLTQNDTLISTTGNIHFHDTVDGDGNGPWSLTVNAANTVLFDNSVGSNFALKNLDVTGGNGIYLKDNFLNSLSYTVNTAGSQTYTGDVYLGYLLTLPLSVVVMNMNAGSDITFNNQIIAPFSGGQFGVALYMVSSGDVFLKDNILMDPANTSTYNTGGYLEVTAGAGKNIYLGTLGDLNPLLVQTNNITIPTSFQTESIFLRSPVVLQQDTKFRVQGVGTFDGTIDSNPITPVSMSMEGNLYLGFINAPIGSINPLQSLYFDPVGNYGVQVGAMSQDTNLFPGIPFMSVTTIGDQYYGNFFEVQVISTGSVTLTSQTGLITFNATNLNPLLPVNQAFHVAGFCSFVCIPTVIHGNTTFNGDASISGTLTMDSGTVTLNGVGNLGAFIGTTKTQEYNGPVILNGTNNVMYVGATNQVTASNVWFTSTSTLNGPGSLTIQVAQTGAFNSYRNSVFFDNAMGTGIATLDVTADKILESASGALTVTNLITHSNEGTDLSQGTNQVQNFSATNGTGVSGQSEDNINLTNTASPLTILGITQNGNNTFINNDVNINNTGAINIAGTITATVPNNTVFLTTNLNITQSVSGVINVYELNTNSNTGTNLTTAANTISNFNATNNVSGDIDLTNTAAPLTLTGITQLVGDVNIVNTGNIVSNGPINAPSNTVTLQAISGSINTIFGNPTVTNLIAISDFGQTIFGTMTNFNSTNNISGGVLLSTPNAVNITGITQNGGPLLLFVGTVTQTGAISVSGSTFVSGSSNGLVDLYTNGGGNNFQGTVGLNSGVNTNILIFNNANLNLGSVNSGADFTAEVSGGNNIFINNSINTQGSQFYNSPVILNSGFSAVLTANNTVQFNSTVDGSTYDSDFLRIDNTNLVIFNGPVGSITPLFGLLMNNVVTTQINTTLVHVSEYQEYEGDVQMQAGAVQLQTDFNGPIDSCLGCLGIFFDGTVTSPNTDLRASGDLYFGYYGSAPVVATLNSLTVDSGMTTFFVQGNLTTTNNQDYSGPVYLIDYGFAMPVTLSSTNGTMIFRDIIISDVYSGSGPVDFTVNGNATFKADIGPNPVVGGFDDGADGRLNVFTVTGNIINFDTTVSQINSLGTQTYTGTGISPLLSIGVDPVFTAPNFVIAIPVFIGAATTYNSTAGDIDFQSTVDGDGISSLILNPLGGSAIFEADVGFTSALGSLAVNGTSSISGATIIQTNGNQIYSDTVTLNNSVTMNTLINGDIQYNGGGVVDAGANTLTASSADSAQGPVGHGITGKVNVTNLILSGPGGANLSENYPVTESFVGGQGGQQARTNTIAPPNVEGVVIYCVNGFNCSPVPVNNIPNNVPPTQVFNLLLGPQYCDASGCSNLAVVFDDVAEAGSINCVVGFAQIMDQAGQKRIAFPGVSIYAGESIVADAGTQVCVKSLDGKIECKTAAR